jgi:hypothetical protein
VKSNLTVRGIGEVHIYQTAGAELGVFNVATPANSDRIGSNLTIQNIRFHGTRATDPTYQNQIGIRLFSYDDVRILDCEFYDFQGAAIYAVACRNLWVERNRCVRNGTASSANVIDVLSGKVAGNTGPIYIRDNYVSDFPTAGIALINNQTTAGGGDPTVEQRAIITGNVVDNGSGWAGIAVENQGMSILIHGNNVRDCKWGIYAADNNANFPGTVTMRRITITDNIIDLGSVDTATSNGALSVRSLDAIVTGNIVRARTRLLHIGIINTQASGRMVVSNNSFVNTHTTTTDTLCVINDANDVTFSNNIIHGTSETAKGLRVERVGRLNVYGNIVHNCDGAPYFGGTLTDLVAFEVSGTAAPTTGTWPAGARVINTAPAASGVIGSVSTESGTPGTCLGFGLIAAS